MSSDSEPAMKPAYSVALRGLLASLGVAIMLLFDFVLRRMTLLYEIRLRKFLIRDSGAKES